MNVILVVLASLIFAVGVYWMCLGGLHRLLVGLLLVSQAINVLIFSVAKPVGAYAPLLTLLEDGSTVLTEQATDPLPQALILTAIVIGMGLIAVVVVLITLSHRKSSAWEEDSL